MEKSKNYPDYFKINYCDQICYINDPIDDKEALKVLVEWGMKHNIKFTKTTCYKAAIKMEAENPKFSFKEHEYFLELFCK